MSSGTCQWILERIVAAAGRAPFRIVLWNGASAKGDGEPVATVHIENRRTLHRLLMNPQLSFGEAYAEGSLEVEGDLSTLLVALYRGSSRSKPGILRRLIAGLGSRPRRNTLRGSKQNIHQHYDLGNEFYELWLDEKMQYTCAYFPEPDCTLEQAQAAKMDHVCRKLRLQPGESVVEAGCGWGGLAIHMARHYGVTVRAYNISHQQVLYAQQRASALGLSDRVRFVEDDYRNITGDYDAFVSVGMLEHVGPDNYRQLGQVIHRALKPEGRGLIHTIGRNKPLPLHPWIERYIFPGAYPPTIGEMMEIFEPLDLSVLDIENLRLHYARTLEAWLKRYERHIDRVTEMYDPAFVRAWRLYLTGSIGAFYGGILQLFQVVFAHAENNQIPMTRAHLYVREDESFEEPKWISAMS